VFILLACVLSNVFFFPNHVSSTSTLILNTISCSLLNPINHPCWSQIMRTIGNDAVESNAVDSIHVSNCITFMTYMISAMTSVPKCGSY
jgi:hypothetical protein